VLFPPRTAQWREGVSAGGLVRMGAPIGDLSD
jgi:hypothetical protein